MKLALISDIHGNVLALDAVLAELESETFDRMVCLGDVAVGPQPREAIARLRELGCPVIEGNWDAAFRHGMPPATDEVSTMLNDIGEFWAGALTAEDRAYMETFESTLRIPLDDGGAVLCFHGSPRSYDDWIFATTPDEELALMFGGREETVLVGGHTHLQLLRRLEHALFVNPGSVGLPFRRWWPNTIRVAPWAEYALLELDGERVHVDLRRTSFDVDALLELCRESGMPHADWWIASWSDED